MSNDPSLAPEITMPPSRRLACAVTLLLAAAVPPGPPHDPEGALELKIRLVRGTDAERATADALRRIVSEHDVERWIFTDSVLIDERSIPHSHPVLTLHTRHLGDDDALLSTFLHEQFHWPVAEMDAARRAARVDFAARWPEVPVGEGEGARDETSTYLHLTVCDLEFQAMTALLGRERAEALMRAQTHYRWIYRMVVEDPEVRRVNARHGFTVDAIVREVGGAG